MTPPTTAQAKFINAILKHGGDRVPGSKVFGKNDIRSRCEIKTVTIESCKERGWVCRDERPGDQMALWTVTADGRTAVGQQVPCDACKRPVTPWRFTHYPRPHKNDGTWCAGGYRTPSGN
jgi:hypothetical protein